MQITSNQSAGNGSGQCGNNRDVWNMLLNLGRIGLRDHHSLSADVSIHMCWRHSGCIDTPQICHISLFQHLWHSRIVHALKCVSVSICCMDQPVILSPITTLLVKSSVYWNCLLWQWLGILCYYPRSFRLEQNFYDIPLAEVNARILPILQFSFLYLIQRALESCTFQIV